MFLSKITFGPTVIDLMTFSTLYEAKQYAYDKCENKIHMVGKKVYYGDFHTEIYDMNVTSDTPNIPLVAF